MALIISTLDDKHEWGTATYPDSCRAVIVNDSLVVFDANEIEIAGFAPGMWGTFGRQGGDGEDQV